jgi:hypothetical protein
MIHDTHKKKTFTAFSGLYYGTKLLKYEMETDFCGSPIQNKKINLLNSSNIYTGSQTDRQMTLKTVQGP